MLRSHPFFQSDLEVKQRNKLVSNRISRKFLSKSDNLHDLVIGVRNGVSEA